ncbi:olfactory receptor 6N2-like [Stigmatopora argus]
MQKLQKTLHVFLQHQHRSPSEFRLRGGASVTPAKIRNTSPPQRPITSHRPPPRPSPNVFIYPSPAPLAALDHVAMAQWNGTTTLVLGGYVDLETFRYLYFSLWVLFYFLIVSSNCVIIYVVKIHPSLHEPMYVFIAALSLNSILISTTVYPKLMVDVLSRRQVASYSGCLLQVFIFYSLAATDLMLLSTMAYDRYVSICRPLQYAIVMGKTRVCVYLALAWFLPACFVAVVIILQSQQKLIGLVLEGIFCNTTVAKVHSKNPTFLVVLIFFGIINVVFLPMVFILFTYVRIFRVAFRSRGEVRAKAVETCLPHVMVLILFTFFIILDLMVAVVEIKLSKILRLILSLQILVYNPLLNPIIYGLKMKEIWKRIKRLAPLSNK